MILETIFGLGGCYLAYRFNNSDYIAAKKQKKSIIEKWNILMDSSSNSENKVSQKIKLLEIISKHYGWNAIVSIPPGMDVSNIRSFIPKIETAFGGNCIIEPVSDKKSCYLRFHESIKDISEKDMIRFVWYRLFNKGDSFRNSYGETFRIDDIKEITNPGNKEIVGYTIKVKIPIGLSWSTLKNNEDILSKNVGKCFIKWNDNLNVAEVDIILKPLGNKEKFIPLKVEPYELYTAMTYSYRPIILDYSKCGNVLIGGKNGTGKTVALIMAIINILLWNDRNKVRVFVGMVSEKQDLAVFKNCIQTDYYASNVKDSLKAIKYLMKEFSRRCDLFSQEDFCFNIYEYNSIHVTDPLPIIHFITDEIADYMPDEFEDKYEKESKGQFIQQFWELARKARNAGIYCSIATQRGDLENMKSNIKAQMGNKMCFYQPNTASALTIFGTGEDTAKRITLLEKSRECLVDYQEGIDLAKTLYLDSGMMKDFLRGIIEANHQHLNIGVDGDIITEVSKEVLPTQLKEDKKSRWEQQQEKKKNSFK